MLEKIEYLNETYLEVEPWLRFNRGICSNEEITWDSKSRDSEPRFDSLFFKGRMDNLI